MTIDKTEMAFIMNKAPHVARCIAENLRDVEAETGERLERDAFTLDEVCIIGAGHTLPDKIPDNVKTIAVNSAIGACLARQRMPDGIVCRESIDMSEQFDALGAALRDARDRLIADAFEHWAWDPPICIFDIGTHPETVKAARFAGCAVQWFVPGSAQTFDLAARLGMEPVYAGGSNVTAAVAIAEMMGAQSIELLGCSRAFSAEGRAYATGTGWEGIRLAEVASWDDNGVERYIGTIAGTECKAPLHERSGQRPPLTRENLVRVTAVDGSHRYAPEPLEGDRVWLETFAARHPHLTLHQHAPDVAIAGWGHAPEVTLPVAGPTVIDHARSQPELAARIAHAIIDGARVVDVPGLIDGTGLVDYAGVADRIVTHKAHAKDPTVGIPATLRVWAEAGDRVKEWLR